MRSLPDTNFNTQRDTMRSYMTLRTNVWWITGFVLVIGLALAVQGWAIWQWPANFDSDEATFALMALHTMQGRLPTYMYGVQYLGAIEAWLSALLMSVFGVNVVVFRWSTLVLYGIFLVLHAMLVARLWNRRVALLSLLVLAFPGPLILWWTYRPIAAFCALLVCGTGALLLATLSPQRRVWQYARLLALGVLFGLGVWSHTMMVIYIAAIAGVAWLRTPEWAALYRRWTTRAVGSDHVLAYSFPLIALGGIAVLGLLAFFSNGCEPVAAFAAVQRVARVGLLGIGGVAGISLVWISQRRRALLTGAGVLTLGVVLGNLPQWYAWLFNGIVPDSAVRPSCPPEVVERAPLVFGQLLPGIWGLPSITNMIRDRSAAAPVWWLLAGLVIAAGVYFLWTYRTTLWALLTVAPLKHSDVPGAGVAILYTLPLVLVALSSNTIDVLSGRYLLLAWYATSIMLALLLVFVWQRVGRTALLALVVFTLVVGGLHVRDMNNLWPAPRYEPTTIAALEQHLGARGVRAGYADYWSSYTLDFLTQERLVIAPYNGVDRYPPYTAQAEQQPVQAFIFWRDELPPDLRTGTDFQALMRQRQGSGLGVFAGVAEQVPNYVVLERQLVGGWDVWIVARS